MVNNPLSLDLMNVGDCFTDSTMVNHHFSFIFHHHLGHMLGTFSKRLISKSKKIIQDLCQVLQSDLVWTHK